MRDSRYPEDQETHSSQHDLEPTAWHPFFQRNLLIHPHPDQGIHAYVPLPTTISAPVCLTLEGHRLSLKHSSQLWQERKVGDDHY